MLLRLNIIQLDVSLSLSLSRSFIPFVQVARHNFFCDFLPVLRRNI